MNDSILFMKEHLAISIIWSLIVHKKRPDRCEITGSKIAVSARRFLTIFMIEGKAID